MLPLCFLAWCLVRSVQGVIFANSTSPYTSDASLSLAPSSSSTSSSSVLSGSSYTDKISISPSSTTTAGAPSSTASTSNGSSLSSHTSASSSSRTSTSTSRSSSSSHTGKCSNHCFVTAAPPQTFFWYPYSFSETIIAATLVVIVNTKYNTTKTSLRLNEIPSGYMLPDINAAGTHVTTIKYTRSGRLVTTEVAFPTKFVQWPDDYQWSGTLDSTGVCLIATSTWASVPLSTFPQLPLGPMPTHPLGPDPEGVLFKPSMEPGGIGDYTKPFGQEGAWENCTMPPDVRPAYVPFTARFMTATMTEYEKITDPPTPAGKPENPGPSETGQPQQKQNPVASEPAENQPGASGARIQQQQQASQQPEQSQAPAQPGQSQQQGASNGNIQPQPTGGNQPGLASPAQLQATQAIPVGSKTIQYQAGESVTAVVLPNGQTLQPGSTMTVDGTPVYLPTSGSAIVVGGATVTFNPTVPTAPSYITIGSETVPLSLAPGQTGILLPNGVTLLPGSSTNIGGTTYSLAPSGTAIIVDGNSIPLFPNPSSSIIVGGNTIPISFGPAPSGGLILPDGKTLLPGSLATISGTTYSLSPSGTALIVDGSSIPLSPNTALSALTLGSVTIPISPVTAPGGGLVLPNGMTLYPGSAVTISGTVISLAPSGTALVVDGTTVPLSNTAIQTLFPYATASNGGVILPGGKTLLSGSSTVISGTTYSLDPTGALVMSSGTSATTVTPGKTGSASLTGGSKSTSVGSSTSSSSQGAGKYIWSGLGGGPKVQTAAAIGAQSYVHVWAGIVFITGVLMIVL